MRTENSLRNIFWTALTFGINFILNFVTKRVFIEILGAEYNGLDGLFTSIISILSIAELGIGTTIIFFLYKPLHEDNKELIKSLMMFYKRCYRIIAGIVLLVGVGIIPFLPTIVGEIDIEVNIYCVYILFLFEAVFSYFFSYKRSIIIADQKERITKYVHISAIIILNLLQIASLYLSKNYYLFISLRIVSTSIENIVLAIIANKKYPYLKEKAKPLSSNIRLELEKRIRAMFYHQIGGFVVNGTDNIMISMMFGVTQVGMYNNYFLIVTSIFSLINNVFSGITASIGNLLVSSSQRKSLVTYNGIVVINYLLASYISCTFYICAQPLVKLWLGDEYMMPELVVGTLAVYLYFKIMKLATVSFKNAAGIFYEDRFIPIIESAVNIVASILCAKLFGVSGIIMGTITSTLILYFGSYPLIVYRKIFNKPAKYYYRQHVTYLVMTAVVCTVVVLASNVLILSNPIIELLKNLAISTSIFVVVGIFLWFAYPTFAEVTTGIIKKAFKKR